MYYQLLAFDRAIVVQVHQFSSSEEQKARDFAQKLVDDKEATLVRLLAVESAETFMAEEN